jgi:hypothetical protein
MGIFVLTKVTCSHRSVVSVHQIVRDLEGNLLMEKTVQQIFKIDNGLISVFEIGDTKL